MAKELYRDKQRASIGGVCAGLADYFTVDVTLVRAIFLIALFGFGTGFLLYIILWIVMPEKKMGNYTNPDETVDYTVDDTGNAQPIAEKKPVAKKEQENVIGGLILVTLGLVFLADELMPWFSFSKLWPLVIVAIGIGLLWNQNRKSN
jgi:phage shock protein PspC (stress-responsive transcriptional regulator)